MIKVKFLDKRLRQDYYGVLALFGLFFAFYSVIIGTPEDCKSKVIFIILITVILLLIYMGLWKRANKLSSVSLKINNTTVNCRIGDIFEENDLKVIAFNEYFDTKVDDKIIASRTLNGMYINRIVNDLTTLDYSIGSDENCEKNLIKKEDRRYGKSKRYKLGTIFQHDDYLLTAFSRFDKENRAYLYMDDYINFLFNFWNELDIVYANRSISIPLMGSGITRFQGYDISEQELLEILIWSLKVSKVNFKSEVTVIIHNSNKDNIDFYRLKDLEGS